MHLQKRSFQAFINHTNRLVYAVDDEYLTIIACRYHYCD
ncbi:type II toxin-antitoxin system YoeB family toxin [Desmonostoc muscorum]|nr:type II toxin-antitoxin system YoeB family toxin [Desmonostoc muscorum]